MSSPSLPALQRLHRLDRSSSDFQDQLSNALYGEEHKRCVSNLQGDDLVWLVDYLDKALDDLDPSSPTSRKCLRELRGICGNRAILPTSYTISSHILNVGPDPFASGGYGDVYKGSLNGSTICVKRVRVYTRDGPQKATKTFCQEAVMWKRLTHPNIVPLLGITITPLQLISNWMSGGDLPEYIEKHSNADRLGLLSDVAKGLCYLHSSNVIHGDLKGPNILVDDSGHARIGDFGLATVARASDSLGSTSRQHGHTARWAAPEVLNEGTYSKEADMFSFAMVMIEVFSGTVPFSNGSSVMAMSAITQGKRPPRPRHPTFTENLWALMQRCWDHKPHLCPEVTEALQVLLTPEEPAWKLLISHTLATHERTSLITRIFSDYDQVKMVGHLSGDDAQTFIDMIDESLDSLAPRIRIACLRYLCRICGRQALLPRSLTIPLCYDPAEDPLCHGEFADVWRGRYHDREVAAKVLRLSPKNDFGPIRRKFCREVVTWKVLRHPNVVALLGVTMLESRFVMVSEWMTMGNINEFVRAHVGADRLKLLGDVTRGLIYMHDQGVIHGNLKGANILIDNNGRACLADFGLHTIASDLSSGASSAMLDGTIRWMSPELLDPGKFGMQESRPTKESDCYALGMVIYEVLSDGGPFGLLSEAAVILRVLRGERPRRPEGDEGRLFTDGIWGILDLCWRSQPRERISAKAILLGLEGSPDAVVSTYRHLDGDVETDTDPQSDATMSELGPSIANGDNGLPAQPHGHPPGVTNLTAPPRKGDSKEGLVGRLVRSARKTFKITTKKIRGL